MLLIADELAVFNRDVAVNERLIVDDEGMILWSGFGLHFTCGLEYQYLASYPIVNRIFSLNGLWLEDTLKYRLTVLIASVA
jgi:hypothetical protein